MNDPDLCNVATALDVLVGKWKPTILLNIRFNGTMRFNQLQRAIPHITQKMLTSQLRELERDGIVTRTVYRQVPPKVEYSLSDYGKTLEPILDNLHSWGEAHLRRSDAVIAE
jgi:DNA-binding HxlR family transcriptional regulator